MPRDLPFIPNLTDVRVRTRGYLPHWEMPDAIYFITYRLHDSLPESVVHALEDERRALKRMYGDGDSALDRARIRLAFEQCLDRALDVGYGAAHLADPGIARVIVENLRQFDGVRYETIAWCVMPTHVHVVVRAIGSQKLSRIVHAWKSYTAKRANEILGREGPFWSREYFDRILRSPEDLRRTVEYVIQNPVKAGLADWPWVGAGEPPADRPASGRRS
jgi:REP element-mobilizing transposase RayT